MSETAASHTVVLVGGGTGSPQLLRALRGQPLVGRATIIVPVTDTGRSTGVVRESLGLPGPGDLRHCLTTLAGPDSSWGRLLERRLSAGGHPDLDGMAVGNLVLAALTQEKGNIGLASGELTRLLDVPEEVLPVSVEDIHLAASLSDGSYVQGELEVRRAGKASIRRLEIEGSPADIWPPAKEALRSADVLILGPGSLWTSVGGVLAVEGAREAVRESKAQIIFVCNTTTQPGQTDDMDFAGHVEVVRGLVGRAPDVVLANDGRPAEADEVNLTAEGLCLIRPDASSVRDLEGKGTRVIADDLLDARPASATLWQKLHTAYHDMEKVATLIVQVLKPDPRF